MQAIKQGYEPKVLLNMMNEKGDISRSHGLPLSLITKQANAMKLPVKYAPTTWEDYETTFINALNKIKKQFKVQAAVFGDIDLVPHREWEEKVCAATGLEAVLPLWQGDRKELVLEMMDSGMEMMIVSCNATLGERFLGRVMDKGLLGELEDLGVDVCGENGEFHTYVVNCPMFQQAIQLPPYMATEHGGYHFLEWLRVY